MEEQAKLQAIKLRLEQADRAVQDAELLFDNQSYSATINRIYYGMFYAVLALAVHHGFKTSKHGQMIGWFNREFVKTKLMEQQMFDILHDAFDLRSEADYDLDPVLLVDQIELMLADMKLFISTIKGYLDAPLKED